MSSGSGGGFQETAGVPAIQGGSVSPTPLRPSVSRSGAVSAPAQSRTYLPGFNSQYHRPPAAVSSYRPSSYGRSHSAVPASKKAKGPSTQTLFSRIRGRVDARYAQAQPRVPASSAQRNHELGQGIHSVFEQVVQRANHFQLDHNGNLKNP